MIPVLGISPGYVVSLVGAGGKTSLLFALAREAAERWGEERVLVTTTTHMFEPDPADFPPLRDENAVECGVSPPAARGFPRVRLGLRGSLAEAVAGIGRGDPLGEGRALLVLARAILPPLRPEGRGKIVGVPPTWVDEIIRRFPQLLVLVEADGSARRPLKAPAGHEPVVPSSTGTVLAVAGLDALGKPLDPLHVHRPEVVARLTGLAPGEVITPEAVATALWHPEGCGKGRPPGSRLIPVLNKVDSPGQLPAARRVAARLLEMGAPLVLLTACREWPVVRESIRPGGGGP